MQLIQIKKKIKLEDFNNFGKQLLAFLAIDLSFVWIFISLI
jgi:hypothetical protein